MFSHKSVGMVDNSMGSIYPLLNLKIVGISAFLVSCRFVYVLCNWFFHQSVNIFFSLPFPFPIKLRKHKLIFSLSLFLLFLSHSPFLGYCSTTIDVHCTSIISICILVYVHVPRNTMCTYLWDDLGQSCSLKICLAQLR